MNPEPPVGRKGVLDLPEISPDAPFILEINVPVLMALDADTNEAWVVVRSAGFSGSYKKIPLSNPTIQGFLSA